MSKVLDGISQFFGIGEGAYNSYLQHSNYQLSKEYQERAWQREDNAVQRRVADLKAAGLSPTLAAGSSADSSGANNFQAPQNSVFERILQAQQIKKTNAEIASAQAEAGLKTAQGEYYAKQTSLLQPEFDMRYDNFKSQKAEVDSRTMLNQAEYNWKSLPEYQQAMVKFATWQANKMMNDSNVSMYSSWYSRDTQSIRKRLIEQQLTKLLQTNEIQRYNADYYANYGFPTDISYAGLSWWERPKAYNPKLANFTWSK